ncbi:presenilins-associated rhomboid-like protein [Arthroderma uncinatum]|uniref:presenilins-associated rhomboid-like protein n=1 Tax=Arthroderma uncinatum TaxID=74035 RepID=UPI00144A90E0|nr:presenilins-associated rhomboid-like protein [Arthroderma uncinatum]KAF3480294.1 presenilins-associated rhomboid-like protein [Arthroderma uncinatum]
MASSMSLDSYAFSTFCPPVVASSSAAPHIPFVNTAIASHTMCIYEVVEFKDWQSTGISSGTERDLPAPQIAQIFGTATISAKQGNRILRAIQEQRVSGIIDLPLPADIARAAPPHIINGGLSWLRSAHPMDEEAAILARIEREEQEEEDRLIRRAEELGIYKPQSGRFGATTVKEGDVYGSSILEEVRKENMKTSKQTEEKKRQEWLDGEAKRTEELQAQARKFKDIQKFEPQELTEARPRADPTVRPALAWIQQQHLRATATDGDASKLTTARRILPSLGVVALTLGLCYLYSETYEEPKREQRLWSDIRPAAATVVTLVGLNVGVFVLWKFVPPAWRLLNRYFVSVPCYPHAASVVGSVFSHQQFRHLGSNMLVLWFIGMRLHEEIGRGDFVAAYLSTGAFATFASFAVRVLSNNLSVSSLGASGAISGIVAMWCIIHSNDKLTIALLPSDWQDKISASGSTFLCAIILVELLNFVPAFRMFAVDLWSHLGGYAAGIVLGLLWKDKKERERRNNPPPTWLKSFGS